MTKFERGLCKVIGCREVASFGFYIIRQQNIDLWCSRHWIEHVGFMARHLYETDARESIIEGVNLYEDKSSDKKLS